MSSPLNLCACTYTHAHSDDEWQATAIDFYYQDVQRIAKARAVPSSADMVRLNMMKNFLSCNDVSVAKVGNTKEETDSVQSSLVVFQTNLFLSTST